MKNNNNLLYTQLLALNDSLVQLQKEAALRNQYALRATLAISYLPVEHTLVFSYGRFTVRASLHDATLTATRAGKPIANTQILKKLREFIANHIHYMAKVSNAADAYELLEDLKLAAASGL